MKKNNMSKKEFISELFFVMVVGNFFFKEFLFQNLNFGGWITTVVIYAGIQMLVIWVCFDAVYLWDRNLCSIIMVVAISMAGYYVLSDSENYDSYLSLYGIAALYGIIRTWVEYRKSHRIKIQTLSDLEDVKGRVGYDADGEPDLEIEEENYAIEALRDYFEDRDEDTPEDTFKCIVARHFRLAFAIASALVLLIPLCQMIIGSVGQNINQSDNVETPDYSFDAQIETIMQLDPNRWDAIISEEEKLEVLQMLVNIECTELGGISRIPTVTLSDDLDEANLGYYSRKENMIVLQRNLLTGTDNLDNLINSICHECRHVAQHAYVDVYEALPEKYQNLVFFGSAKEFKEEFDNYKDGGEMDAEELQEYYNQEVEEDARQWASMATLRVWSVIHDYKYGGAM